MQAIKHVDILDLVEIRVMQGQSTPTDPVPIRILVDPLDKTKNVVFDATALNVMNNKMVEFVIDRQLDVREKNTFKYIEEFVARMITELYKNGLMKLEDVPEASDDPYKKVKDMYDSRTGKLRS